MPMNKNCIIYGMPWFTEMIISDKNWQYYILVYSLDTVRAKNGQSLKQHPTVTANEWVC